jgi:hypothetical protein
MSASLDQLAAAIQVIVDRITVPEEETSCCEGSDEHTCECGEVFFADFDHADDEMCGPCDDAWFRESQRRNAEYERDTR